MNHEQRAKAMSDGELLTEEVRLKRTTAQAQALLAAVRRERRRRANNAKKAAQ